jgi:UDP-3-O-[3-hydroxymyristoyl] glucosamine N-acyltransferase
VNPIESISLKELAEKLNAQLIGDGSVKIFNVATIENAKKGELTYAEDNKSIKMAYKTQASAIILPYLLQDLQKPIILAENPKLTFAKALEIFSFKKEFIPKIDKTVKYGKNFKAKDVRIEAYVVIGDNVNIGKRSIIYPFVYIGDEVKIGSNCIIYPHVVINDRVSIGNNVIIHAGAVIGADGFGYVNTNGKNYKIPHNGCVDIEDDVEIGANVTIDRATTGTTRIKQGTKIDNLVHIAHNVEIGKNCILVAQVGISGSVKLEDNVVLAGQVGVTDHVKIRHNTIAGAKSGITKDIGPNMRISGFPAREHKKHLKTQAMINKLPELFLKVKELEKKINQPA